MVTIAGRALSAIPILLMIALTPSYGHGEGHHESSPPQQYAPGWFTEDELFRATTKSAIDKAENYSLSPRSGKAVFGNAQTVEQWGLPLSFFPAPPDLVSFSGPFSGPENASSSQVTAELYARSVYLLNYNQTREHRRKYLMEDVRTHHDLQITALGDLDRYLEYQHPYNETEAFETFDLDIDEELMAMDERLFATSMENIGSATQKKLDAEENAPLGREKASEDWKPSNPQHHANQAKPLEDLTTQLEKYDGTTSQILAYQSAIARKIAFHVRKRPGTRPVNILTKRLISVSGLPRANIFKYYAALALGGIKSPHPVSVLVTLMVDRTEHHQVREAAAWALGEIGLKLRQSIKSRLYSRFDQQNRPTHEYHVDYERHGVPYPRVTAKEVEVKHFDHASGLDEILQSLESVIEKSELEPIRLRREAVKAIGKLLPPALFTQIQEIAYDRYEDPIVRQNAIWALGEYGHVTGPFGEGAALDVLTGILNDSLSPPTAFGKAPQEKMLDTIKTFEHILHPGEKEDLLEIITRSLAQLGQEAFLSAAQEIYPLSLVGAIKELYKLRFSGLSSIRLNTKLPCANRIMCRNALDRRILAAAWPHKKIACEFFLSLDQSPFFRKNSITESPLLKALANKDINLNELIPTLMETIPLLLHFTNFRKGATALLERGKRQVQTNSLDPLFKQHMDQLLKALIPLGRSFAQFYGTIEPKKIQTLHGRIKIFTQQIKKTNLEKEGTITSLSYIESFLETAGHPDYRNKISLLFSLTSDYIASLHAIANQKTKIYAAHAIEKIFKNQNNISKSAKQITTQIDNTISSLANTYPNRNTISPEIIITSQCAREKNACSQRNEPLYHRLKLKVLDRLILLMSTLSRSPQENNTIACVDLPCLKNVFSQNAYLINSNLPKKSLSHIPLNDAINQAKTFVHGQKNQIQKSLWGAVSQLSKDRPQSIQRLNKVLQNKKRPLNHLSIYQPLSTYSPLRDQTGLSLKQEGLPLTSQQLIGMATTNLKNYRAQLAIIPPVNSTQIALRAFLENTAIQSLSQGSPLIVLEKSALETLQAIHTNCSSSALACENNKGLEALKRVSYELWQTTQNLNTILTNFKTFLNGEDLSNENRNKGHYNHWKGAIKMLGEYGGYRNLYTFDHKNDSESLYWKRHVRTWGRMPQLEGSISRYHASLYAFFKDDTNPQPPLFRSQQNTIKNEIYKAGREHLLQPQQPWETGTSVSSVYYPLEAHKPLFLLFLDTLAQKEKDIPSHEESILLGIINQFAHNDLKEPLNRIMVHALTENWISIGPETYRKLIESTHISIENLKENALNPNLTNEMRHMALRALGDKEGSGPALKMIVKGLGKKGDIFLRKRSYASLCLKENTQTCIDTLLKISLDPEETQEIRQYAITTITRRLLKMTPQERKIALWIDSTQKSLIKVYKMKKNDYALTLEILKALSAQPNKESLEIMIHVLKADDEQRKLIAIQALGEPQDAEERRRKLLKNLILQHSTSIKIRLTAARSLYRIGNPRDRPWLFKMGQGERNTALRKSLINLGHTDSHVEQKK